MRAVEGAGSRSRRDCGNREAEENVAKEGAPEERRSRRDCGNREAGYSLPGCIARRFGRSRRDCGNREAEIFQLDAAPQPEPQSPRLRQS